MGLVPSLTSGEIAVPDSPAPSRSSPQSGDVEALLLGRILGGSSAIRPM